MMELSLWGGLSKHPHCSREMCCFSCCWRWGEPACLCLGYIFSLLPPLASFPWLRRSSPHSPNLSIISRPDPLSHRPPTHHFVVGSPRSFFSFRNFWIRFWIHGIWTAASSDHFHARPFSLQPAGHAQPPPLCVTSTNTIFPRVSKVFPSVFFVFFLKHSGNRRWNHTFKVKEDKSSRSRFIW